MKKIKLQKLITGIMLSALLIISSCSREDEDINVVDENINLTTSLTSRQTDIQRIANAIDLAIDEFNDPQSGNFLSEEIDQKTIDAYIEQFKLEGIVNSDAKAINEIIKKTGEAFETGTENYINNSSYSDYTKRILITQSSGSVIAGLEKQRGFSLISSEEQELLLFNNDLIEEFLKINNNRTQQRGACANANNPEGCGIGAIIGITIGGAIGGGLCGPPCSAAGAFLGAIIGGAIGGGGKQ